MSIVLDTNVYISYLLGSKATSPPALLVTAGVTGLVTLVCSTRLIGEIRRKVTSSAHLSGRIPEAELDVLIETLQAHSRMVADQDHEFPSVTRDPKDDFLVALALRSGAEHLVSGDNDLRDLGSHEGVAIVNPARMVEILGLGS